MRGWLQRALLAISRNFILCSIHEDLWWLRSFMTWYFCRATTTKLSLAKRKIQDWHVLAYTSFELFSKYCVELSSGRYIQDNALIWVSNDSGLRVGYMSIILMYHSLLVDCKFQTTVFKQGIIVPVIFRSIYRYEPAVLLSLYCDYYIAGNCVGIYGAVFIWYFIDILRVHASWYQFSMVRIYC